MMRNGRTSWAIAIGCILILVAGCTATIVSTIYTSSPEIQTLSRPDYDIRFQPVTDGQDFFSMFKLDVTNKTDMDLEIDWNMTQYTQNGKNRGGFVFEGINSEDVKNGTIPNDVVPRKGRFSKEIAPHQLIAMAPMGSRSTTPDQSGISGGILPDGVNGILLVIVQDGRPVKEKLAVTIVSQERK